MYGTVALLRIKPGEEQQLMEEMKTFERQQVPGFISSSVYRMDADPQSCYLAVLFESKEAYWANARSPEQDARYQKLRAHLAADPEWHDGEIIASHTQG
ncbi:MAG TPA: antibiotic biosynthesis monooxygenase [Ktedonobacterales bacterium]